MMLSKDEDAELIRSGYLPTREVLRRYKISAMSLHRWLNSATMNFPKPVKFGRFKYWRFAEIEAWELSRIRDRSAA